MYSDDELRDLRKPPPDDAPAWVNDPATENQIMYIRRLIEDAEVPKKWLERIDELTQEAIATHTTITKGKAGEIIQALRKLPVRKGHRDRSKAQPDPDDVPAGYYALQTGEHENDITFYKVWRNNNVNPKAVAVFIQAGDDLHRQSPAVTRKLLKDIYRAGMGEAAVLYGRKISRCSQCHRTLTKRLSRELGIGPVCGSRVFQDGWDERVNSARNTLLEAGVDPNETV
jgi:hypothetical protein